MRAILLSLAFLLTGCVSDVIPLEERWRPLRRVVQDDLIPKGVYTTLGSDIHTDDLRDFRSRNEVTRDALLLHEQSHARREAELGLAAFLAAYVTDRRFRWEEESAGWRLELVHLVRNGYGIDVPYIAGVLSSDAYAWMVDYGTALAWVAATVTEAGGAR